MQMATNQAFEGLLKGKEYSFLCGFGFIISET
jgi:hypothetical protein